MMNFILSKYFIRFLTIFLLLAIALQPFNWFCNYSQKCQPLYLSELIPTFEGNKPITIIPEVKNYNKYLEFEILTKNFSTVTGRKNQIKYKIKNLNSTFVKFRPKFYTNPQEYSYYMIRKNCLCFEEIVLKKGEEKEFTFTFKVHKDFDKDDLESAEDRTFSIGYIIEN